MKRKTVNALIVLGTFIAGFNSMVTLTIFLQKKKEFYFFCVIWIIMVISTLFFTMLESKKKNTFFRRIKQAFNENAMVLNSFLDRIFL